MKSGIHFRYGPLLPDDDVGREELDLRLQVISLGDDAEERMRREADLCAPWMAPEELHALIEQIMRTPVCVRGWVPGPLASG